MVPHDDFTPYGYLDNPYHSWKLNSSGVLRSLAPLGMGWHVPNLGSYVLNQFQYTAHLTLGLKIHDLVLVTLNDFRLYWLLRISVRKIGSLKDSIWYFDLSCHCVWRGRSCEANAFALWHKFLKPEIQLAMWSQEEC